MAMLFAVLFAAACSDSPTAPDGTAIGAAGPSNTYIMDPLIVKGKCDPIMSIDWCGGSDPGGDCMTGAGDLDMQYTSGCPGGGGGVGGGGEGGTVGGSTGGTGGSKASSDDSGPCPGCGERQPTPDEKPIMEEQLKLVTCADGKAALEAAFAAQGILVYTVDDGRWGSHDSASGLLYISRPKHWLPTGVDTGELADTMVHEIVHKLLGHTNGQPHAETHGTEFRNKMASCGFPQP